MSRFAAILKLLLASALLGVPLSGCAGRVDRSRLPSAGAPSAWSPSPVQELEINGRDLWYVKADHVPLVSLRILIPAGTADECEPGALALLADWLREGAGDYDTYGFDRALKSLATDLWFSAGEDYFVVGIDALARNFSPSVALVRQALLAPHLEPEYFEKIRTLQAAQAAASLEDPDYLRRRLTRRVLHREAGYPYARLSSGSQAQLEALSPESVTRAHQWLLSKLGEASIVAVGAVDLATISEELSFEMQANLPERTMCSASATYTQPEETKPTIHFWRKEGAPQTGITVVRPLPRSDENYFGDTLFARVLGSAFTSRLNMNLREDKGYTYGAFGGFQRSPRADVFALSSRVRADTTFASLQEMLSELKSIAGTKPISADEFEKSQQGLILGYPQRFGSIGAIAGHLSELRELGRGPEWIQDWSEGLRATTREAAQKRAEQLGNSDYFIVMVGDPTHAKELEKEYKVVFYNR